ncbi:hypothetical protein [Paenibacillus koleovorans]|uniref:hypothetical protein n=1 Tax=Paenibacillus koleovorans TaxID=121608 RepID=UPI000FD81F57|nr:hypothetical protein [Paenibacillus koleovorans]
MNILRIAKIIKEVKETLQLDLKGLTVYTEAGTGMYACTPVIAALAGAEKVYAISRDTRYGTSEQAVREVNQIAAAIHDTLVDRICHIHNKIDQQLFEADIVTNLGHVRPIDKTMINKLNNDKVVIPYMCEAWEVRPGDVDLNECLLNNIPVMGTNETHPGVNCFKTCGHLVAKLLFEAGLEIRKNKIAIFSSDHFGHVIHDLLQQLEADVTLFECVKSLNESNLDSLDALIIADYMNRNVLVGERGLIDLKKIAEQSSGIVLVPFAGHCEMEYVKSLGIQMYPMMNLEPVRMSRTLAHVGPMPTIELLAAGLKVGELMRRAKKPNLTISEIVSQIETDKIWAELAQPIHMGTMEGK